MKKYQLHAKDGQGRELIVFSPTFEGTLQDALQWFSSRDWIYNNPNISEIIIKEVNKEEEK